MLIRGHALGRYCAGKRFADRNAPKQRYLSVSYRNTVKPRYRWRGWSPKLLPGPSRMWLRWRKQRDIIHKRCE